MFKFETRASKGVSVCVYEKERAYSVRVCVYK